MYIFFSFLSNKLVSSQSNKKKKKLESSIFWTNFNVELSNLIYPFLNEKCYVRNIFTTLLNIVTML